MQLGVFSGSSSLQLICDESSIRRLSSLALGRPLLIDYIYNYIIEQVSLFGARVYPESLVNIFKSEECVGDFELMFTAQRQ